VRDEGGRLRCGVVDEARRRLAAASLLGVATGARAQGGAWRSRGRPRSSGFGRGSVVDGLASVVVVLQYFSAGRWRSASQGGVAQGHGEGEA
jgi:hypothetical protein